MAAPIAASTESLTAGKLAPDVALQKPDMDMIESKIRYAVGNAIGGQDPDLLEVDVSLLELGLDSLSSLELRNQLQKDFGLKLNAQLVFDYPTVQALSDNIYGALETQLEKMRAIPGA